jgi:Oxidoreductase family, NAD-binding Rossmann fold
MNELRLGIIGLDTSHVEGFAAKLNDPSNPEHIPGGRIVAGFPGGSPDFPLSRDRVEGFTRTLRERYGVEMLGSPREVAEATDAVLHTSADGRVHLAQFREIAPAGKPVFMDKPFATTSADAREMAALARRHSVPLFCSSTLRFCGALRDALGDASGGRIIGADFFGPLYLQPTQHGFFWYGVHAAEMLYAALGAGCERVRVASSADHDVTTGVWRDGRIGTVRGDRAGNKYFGGVVHREGTNQWVDAEKGLRPDLGLTRAVMDFFRGAPAPVALDEMVELVRFLEAANESRDNGGREVVL